MTCRRIIKIVKIPKESGRLIDLYYCNKPDDGFTLSVTDPTDVATSNTTVTGLFADTGYKFRMKAVNKHGVGVASLESRKYWHF